MLDQLGQEVEGVEHVDVLLEVFGVHGVKKNPSFERVIADLLQRDRRSCDVLSEAFL